jgi:acyl carrier protein
MKTSEDVPMSVKSEVLAQFTQVAEEQNRKLATLTDDLPLLESGLDSLCFAVIVARLEDMYGVDPFSAADDSPFPVTLGDFVKSYENAAA